MAKIKMINLKGEQVKELTLNDEIFKVEGNDVVLKKAIRLQLDSSRQGTADTKGRSEVVFGPTPRDYGFKTNRKERRLALNTALTDKLNEKALVVVDSLELKTAKTKDAIALLDGLKLTGKTLFVSAHDAEMLYLATRNLGNVAVIMADELNVFDIVNADTLVMDEDSVKYVEEALK